MIVTIDGPAGAGKSSTAKALAARLGFEFLDTGAMYRAVTLAALRARINLADQHALGLLLATLRIELLATRVFLNGEDITGLIRTSTVTAASGPIADSPGVRQYLVDLQRRLAAGKDVVCEGRDQGTVAFPNAECKFFLVADPAERARRRQQDLQGRGEALSVEHVLKAQAERDSRDAGRSMGPMVPAADAIHIDSTGFSIDQVVTLMENVVRQRLVGRAFSTDG